VAPEQDNLAVLREIYDAYSSGSSEKFLNAMIGDVRFGIVARPKDFRFGGIRKGRRWAQRVILQINQDYQWLKYEVREFIAQGDRVVALTGGRVRHRASGAVMTVDLVDVLRMKDGKIVEFTEHFDTANLLAKQAGRKPGARQKARKPRSARPRRARTKRR
jgi:ketosteroid isomerase-like protein